MAVKTPTPLPNRSVLFAVPVEEQAQVGVSAAAERVGSSAIRDILAVTERPEIISLAGGLPIESAFPTAELAEASQRVLAEHGGAALQYSTTAGHPGLRAWVADRMGAGLDQVVVTHGSQQALELVIRAVVDPGTSVALGDPAYVGALQALRLAGADLAGIPSDGGGLCVDVLADRLAAGLRPALVYVVANFDNPSGTTLPLERRLALAELADRYGFLIVEDDPYGELRWAGERLPGLATMSDRVVTLGTTSKILCPGLRVGWATGPADLARSLVLLKQATDLHTASLNQLLVHDLVTRPAFLVERLPRLRRLYAQHSAALASALHDQLGDRLRFATPEGGMFVWAAAPGIDTDALLPVAIDHGVAFVPGRAFSVDDHPTEALRFSFATTDGPGLREAVRRLAAAVAAMG